jgi:homoserine kinase type II
VAVYTDISEEELATFAAAYDIGDVVSCKGIAEGIENSNFLLRTTEAAYILTIYEKRVQREDLPFFLGLMQHLSARGIACPTPIAGHDGAVHRLIAGKSAALISFLDGIWMRRPTPSHCAQLGETMARMHLAGADFALTRPNALAMPGWRGLFEKCAGRADEVAEGLADELAAHLDTLEARWPSALPHGVIHADLFPDNVFFLGGRLSGIIDFYFACNDVFAYDLAVALNAWCFEADQSFNVTKAGRLIDAYAKVRPMDEAETAALPLLATGAALRFLLTRLYDRLHQVEGALVRPKDPLEFLYRLRFHAGVRDLVAYGLT